jgi:hypothetical protein
MALNALELGFFDELLRGGSKALKTPEQLATDLKNHAQKEIDAQFLQNPFTADDIPLDSFQKQNTKPTDTDDDNDPNTPPVPIKPKPLLPTTVPQKIKQWLG